MKERLLWKGKKYMNTLIIDCSAGMSILLIKDKQIYKKIDNNQKRHSDELLLAVDNLLLDAQMSVKDITNICVCVGPGSFTGIRVAISICKGLSIGTGAKIFIASNFDIFSYGQNENSVYLLDGFSDFIYMRTISDSNTMDSCEHTQDVIEKIKNECLGYKVFVSSEKIKNKLEENDITCSYVENKSVECFEYLIKNDSFTEINQINPIYLRASQAEIERNQKLKEEK